MQGVVYMPHNLETGSSPPHKDLDTNENMDLTTAEPNITNTKEPPSNQSNRSDSGFLSATNNTTYPDSEDRTHHENGDTDNRSDCSSPGRKYYCPICENMLTSQHEFTLHIRSHNNDTDSQFEEKGFVCRICSKILSSSSSLDRHVLVHSGERPFTCKYCGDTFTTNGNMHRHMRTHSFKNEYESDGSSDSSSSNSKNVEYNNNKVDRREKRKLELCEDYKSARIKLEEDEEDCEKHRCPICGRNDFTTKSNLEIHLEDNHPDYPVKCHECNSTFKNNKLLSAHKSTVHEESSKVKSSVTGFKNLTFVDFSSEKFPHIARHECEKNLHKASSGLKFQCQKCSRAFPCANSLEIHQNECCVGLDLSISNDSSVDLTKPTKLNENDIKRADFFSRLDLQDNSPEKNRAGSNSKLQQKLLETVKNIDNSKDLADIQTIISMTTNGSFLQHLQAKSDIPNQSSNDLQIEKTEEEEAQDIFAKEFRKMKLRGEFPCRLCTAVFPNLRALKGHNRAHLNGNTNGTYRCNMCPHSSVDKAALIRHMRTHNGDRPYECSLCNYAFTTKANCERHLRNRHAKTTREEVKKSIIYHPSEDPTNDEMNKLTIRDDTKKINSSFNSVESNDMSPEKIRSSTPKLDLFANHAESNPLIPLSAQIQAWRNPYLDKSPTKPHHSINDIMKNETTKTIQEHRLKNELPYLQPPINFIPKPDNASTPQKSSLKINVKNLDSLIQPPEYDYSDDEKCESYPDDEPIDLSKKKTPDIELEDDGRDDETPEDLSNKNSNLSPFSMSEILAQQLLMKNTPKIDHAANFYAAQFALLRNSFHGWPPFSALNPLLFQNMPNTVLPQEPEVKRLQRQLCGGRMINSLNERQSFQNLNSSSMLNSFKAPNQIKSEEMTPLSLNVDPAFTESSPVPQAKPDLIQSPNSVKMVIKNGVLMPKQKQRRYRTERPFSCEHCSARFTLRSNMERHIKQQHPQFWSQRQRSNIGNTGRKTAGLPSSLHLSSYEPPKNQDYDDNKGNHISDKIKYAILAQHLRSNQEYKNALIPKKEDEDECALVIDENESKSEGVAESKHAYDDSAQESLDSHMPKLDALLSNKPSKQDETQDLVSVSRLLDNASQQQFKEYFKRESEDQDAEGASEEDEEGLVASGSTSEANSGTDENKSESENVTNQGPTKKKSAYSLAPNRVSCPYCNRKFPWTSSLRRHILTHTGQKPFKCSHCPLLFTTKSNCDRHLLRKHGSSATTIANEGSNNNANYLMRNVPERPFKCSNCPSSTFSTYSNLKKHMSCKHGSQMDDKSQGYEAGSSEDEKQNQREPKNDWDAHISNSNKMSIENQGTQTNSDLPFKCHLCEGSFAERHDCLDHIKDKHPSEYELLMSKNALDNNASTPEESTNHDEDENEIRGKFPDYSNRKVICAFCMRRFWSAEDLRRHMRTHTGERPFSCDICRRRFTLKHSMLRHRKKHNVAFENDNLNSDEDNVSPSLEKLKSSLIKSSDKTDESDGNEGNDLISNLLGIRDRSIIEQVLTASPDDAAKLLGVKNGNQD